MSDFLNRMKSAAKADLKTIVLPEGEDPRTIVAATKIIEEGLAKIVILGNPDEINVPGATVIDPRNAEKHEEYAQKFAELRAKKGVTIEQARAQVMDATYFGTMMVKMGDADGLVSGACHSTADTLRTALEKVGVTVNPTLWDFYTVGAGKDYARSKSGMVAKSSEVTAEVPWDVYTDEVKDSVAQYGDAAIVTLSRVGGEGADLSYGEVNYLALDENEKAMLQNVAEMKKNGTVKKTILLINSANALQVDFLKNNEYDIDAALWIGDVGISGINAVAEILTGKVNPSGSLVDTYCYDNFSAPAMWNFTPTIYEGYVEGGDVSAKAKSYMIYQEGIYVGYKYYETRYEDFVTGNGNAGDYAYGDIVAYPFGYGMSYTNFDISDMNVSYNAADDTYTVTVKVTNTGDMAGKKTVQVYVQSPYTDYDKENGVEKSAVSLVGFGKTGMIEPGASETLSMTVNKRDIASYDTYGAGTYILDAGDYYFTAATDAHNAVNNILAAKGYTVESTNGKMTADGNADLTYTWTEEALDTTTYATSENGTAITNQLSCADPNLYEGIEETVTWLSRSDWNGTLPTETVKLALTDLLKKDLKDIRYDPADYESVDMAITTTLFPFSGCPFRQSR